MQEIAPRVGEVYRRNGMFREGVEHMFNVVRWHAFVVDHVTPTHVCGTIITQLILEEGEGFSCSLTDFTDTFFSLVKSIETVGGFLPLEELICVLNLADSYLDLFGYRYEEGGDGLLPYQALGLAGLPGDIARATGRQLCLAVVRGDHDLSPELAQFKYGDSCANLRIVVELSLDYYLGDSWHFFSVSDPDVFRRLITHLNGQ